MSATETLNILVKSQGTKTVARDLMEIGGAAERSSRQVALLEAALKPLASVLAVGQLVRWANEWQVVAGKIRSVAGSATAAGATIEQLYQVAMKTHTGLSDVAVTYQRVALAAKDLGRSGQDAIDFVETINKVLAINKLTAQGAKGALLQLGQALTTGVVKAEEFNSVVEGLPQVLQLVADKVQGANGSIGRLRQIMLQGKLTSKEFWDAIAGSKDKVDAAFKRTTVSIAQGVQDLQTGFLKFVGTMDEFLGISNAVGRALGYIGAHVKELMAVLAGVAAGLAVAFAPTAIALFTTQIGRLIAIVRAANLAAVFGAIGAVLSALPAVVIGVVTAMSLSADKIKLTTNGLVTLADVFTYVWQGGQRAAAAFLDWLTPMWQSIAGLFGRGIAAMGKLWDEAAPEWLKPIGEFFDGAGSGLKGFTVGTARVLDRVVALWRGAFGAITQYFVTLIDLWKDIFGRIGNFAQNTAAEIANSFLRAMNNLNSKIGVDKRFELFSPEQFKTNDELWKNLGADIAKAAVDGYNSQGKALEKAVLGGWQEIEAIGRRRILAARRQRAQEAMELSAKSPAIPPILNTKQTKPKKSEAEKERERWAQLLDQLDPVLAAQRKYAEGQALINEYVKKGTDDHTRYTAALHNLYKDQLTPLAKIQEDMQKQTSLLKLNSQDREVQSKLMEYQQQLQKAGVALTKEQTQELGKQVRTTEELAELSKTMDTLRQDSFGGQQRQAATMVQAISELRSKDAAGFTRRDLAQTMNDLFKVDTPDTFQNQIDQTQALFETIQKMRDADLISYEAYQQAKASAARRAHDIEIEQTNALYNEMGGLMRSRSKTLFTMGKAAAVAQAIINANEAATKAWAQGGIYGAALAAATLASAMVQVNNIRSQQPGFMTGGTFKVGGTGGPDSQMVSFRASPGERVTVATPAQVRKGTSAVNEGQQSAPNVTVNPRIINVLDPSLVGDYLGTAQGEKAIVNIMQRNKGVLGV